MSHRLFKDYNPEVSLASWALRYVGTLPGVKVILSGMSTLAQVKDNLETFKEYQNLNEEELAIVYGDPEHFHEIQEALKAAGIEEFEVAEISMIPQNEVTLSDEDKAKFERMLEMLE